MGSKGGPIKLFFGGPQGTPGNPLELILMFFKFLTFMLVGKSLINLHLPVILATGTIPDR